MFIEQFVQTGGVETDYDFFSDDHGGSDATLVGADEFEDGGLAAAYVAFFVDDASRREVASVTDWHGGQPGCVKNKTRG
jgi:hypothetical protein